MAAHAQSVFRSRSFTSFYIGQACSYVGDGLRIIAIPLLVFHLTHSALSIGITYALELAPFALFGPIGGSLADRIDRKRLMIACDAIRCVVLVAFAIGFARGSLSLPMLYAGIFIMALAAATFVGAQSSSLPYLLGKDRVTSAVSALLAAEQISATIVPPIGGAIFALVGPLPALIVNAATYLISQTTIATIHDLGPERRGTLPSLREIASDIARGFSLAFRDPTMRTIALLSLVFNFFAFIGFATWIPYLKRDFSASDQTVGIALGISAIGAVLGSFVAGRIPKSWSLGRVLPIAYIADGVFFLPVALTHDIRIAIVFSALSSACVLFQIAQIVSWRIRVTPNDMIGRVFGAVRLVSLSGTVPGSLLGGAIADRYGAREATTIAAIGYLAVAIFIGALPQIRGEKR